MILSILNDTKYIVAPPKQRIPEYEGLTQAEAVFLKKWLVIPNRGDILEGTNMIPSKTFLMAKKWTRHTL